jgi:molybdopterin converting factor small subunit
MATTTKKTATKTEDTEIETSADELSALKQELAELKKLKAELESFKTKPVQQTTSSKKYVTFVNLANSGIVLKGTKMHNIEKQFDKKRVLETEARNIVANTPNLISSGKVYIADYDFVKDCELDDLYSTMLTPEQMENLFEQNSGFIIDAYNGAPEGQKKVIIDMIIEKKQRGEKVDGNVLVELGELCGKNLVAIEKVEEME